MPNIILKANNKKLIENIVETKPVEQPIDNTETKKEEQALLSIYQQQRQQDNKQYQHHQQYQQYQQYQHQQYESRQPQGRRGCGCGK
jgi:hypothetical protein